MGTVFSWCAEIIVSSFLVPVWLHSFQTRNLPSRRISSVGELEMYPEEPQPAAQKDFLFTLEYETLNSPNGAHESRSRCGRLSIKNRRQVETPNFLGITSRGVLPHITPDVLSEHTDISGVHMALEDYIERSSSSTPPVMSCPPRKSTPLHTFTALPAYLITLVAPRRTPAVTSPNGNSEHGISIFTSVGFQALSTSIYGKFIKTLMPDITIGLGDVAYGKLPGVKRREKMGDRTSSWLDTLIADLKNSEATSESPSTALFAPILPIDFHNQSDYVHHLVDDLADSISGLAFYSSNVLVDIPETTWITRLPRLSLDEPASPHEILRQVSLGMDLFTIPFIGFVTDAGLALVFTFPPPPMSDNKDESPSGTPRVRDLATDIFSSTLSKSVKPLFDGCSCYACTSHHCAFIQHLLSAKEMLGWVLLQIHNHHTMSSFFYGIRTSIKAGTFEEDYRKFTEYYDGDFPDGTGQKPRARGYHFKSEGPGEGKKNKPAWGTLGEEKGDAEEMIEL